MEGWIKTYRSLLDNPIIMKDKDYLATWIYLLLNATHSKYDALFNGKRITLNNGQLITGRKSISEKLKIDESKVQRILKSFENEQQIEQQTGTRNRLVTILNWDKYQENEQQNAHQMNNNCTTSEQQVNTNKNVKNIKNERNNKKEIDKEKMHFAEFVSMTNVEYEKLVNTYGKEAADQCIKVLDNYKGASGKKYKSDFRAILSWVINKVQQEKGVKNGPNGKYSGIDLSKNLYKPKTGRIDDSELI